MEIRRRDGRLPAQIRPIRVTYDALGYADASVIFEQGDEAVVDAAFKGDERIAVSGISAIKGTWLGLGGE